MNSSIILQAIGFGTPATKGTSQGIFDNLHNITVGNLILSVGGLIPGYWVSFLFVDSWGRKPIQILGFTMLTILFIVMGFGYEALLKTDASRKAFVFLYCLTNFFQNFGTNTTSKIFLLRLQAPFLIIPICTAFIIPGEVFPTRYRSTGHGISAASGKLGAIVAQVGFAQLKDIGGPVNGNAFVGHILEMYAPFNIHSYSYSHSLFIPASRSSC